MSAYRKYMFICVAFFGTAMAFGSLAIYVTVWFVLPFLVTPLVAGYLMQQVLCPHCAAPVIYQGGAAR